MPSKTRAPGLILVLALVMSLPGCENSGIGDADAAIAGVRHAADDARRQCQAFMHEDADEYVSCLDSLLARENLALAPRERVDRRLGLAYFGWVGANNSARIALPGAVEATTRYRRIFRPLQRQMMITDQALCRAVEGPCEARIAQLREQERDEGLSASGRAVGPR